MRIPASQNLVNQEPVSQHHGEQDNGDRTGVAHLIPDERVVVHMEQDGVSRVVGTGVAGQRGARRL